MEPVHSAKSDGFRNALNPSYALAEVYRSAQDHLATRAACIEKNFMPLHDKYASGYDAVLENIDRAKDRTVEVGSYIERTIDAICSPGGGAQVSPLPAMEPATTSVR